MISGSRKEGSSSSVSRKSSPRISTTGLKKEFHKTGTARVDTPIIKLSQGSGNNPAYNTNDGFKTEKMDVGQILVDESCLSSSSDETSGRKGF